MKPVRYPDEIGTFRLKLQRWTVLKGEWLQLTFRHCFDSSDSCDCWVRMQVMKYLLLAGLAIVVSACSSKGPSFTNMDGMELAAYNRELPPEKHVYCVQEADTSTYIRKSICRSYEDWVALNERAAMTLDVLNSRPNYSLANSIQDGPSHD